jgi:hypothetical protein
VGTGVAVGAGVAVGSGIGVEVGKGVAVGAAVGEGGSVGVAGTVVAVAWRTVLVAADPHAGSRVHRTARAAVRATTGREG